MHIATLGINLIKAHEGIEIKNGMAVPYMDPTGYPTIGWGCRSDLNGNPVTLHTLPVTLAQAEMILRRELADIEQDVMRLIVVPLNQNQFDALVSFTFNEGEGNLASSTLRRKLNAKDYWGASQEFPKWNMGHVNGQLVVLNGLVSRRADEQKLFLQPI